MPSTPAGIIVDPNGQTVTVNITQATSGAAVAVYTSKNGDTVRNLPSSHTGAPVEFWVVQPSQYIVSMLVNGSENANGRGGTRTVDLRAGGTIGLQAGGIGDGPDIGGPGESFVTETRAKATYSTLTERDLVIAAQRNRELYEAVFADIRIPAGKVGVALRWDDIPDDDFLTLWPLLQARGLVAEFAAISGRVGVAGVMTTTQLRTLAANGNEITHHSDQHGSNPVSPEEFYAETAGSLDTLTGYNLWRPAKFVQPGTWNSGDQTYYFDRPSRIDGTYAERVFRATYAAAVAYVYDAQNGEYQPVPHPRRFGATAHKFPTTFAEGEALLKAAQGGITLGGHTAQIEAGTSISWADLTALLDLIVTMRDAGKIVVLNPTSLMFAQYGPEINQWVDGDLALSTSANFIGWQKVNSPTVVAGGISGNALSTNTTHQAFQEFSASAVRYGYFEAYAKLSAAGTAQARVKIARYDGTTATSTWAGTGTSTGYALDIRDFAITDTGWTKIRFPIGSAPAAAGALFSPKTRITLSGAVTSAQSVLWDDVRLVKC